MGLVFQTVLFVIINVIVGALLISSQGIDPLQNTPDIPFESGDASGAASISLGDIEDSTIGVRVDSADFNNAGIPEWFTWSYLLINGVWLIALIAGWLRGNH